MPAMTMQMWSPAVPDDTPAAYGAPTASARSASNRGPAGPSESRPERSTSRTSSSSCSSIQGALRPSDRVAAELTPLRPAVGQALHRVEIRLLELQGDRSDADLLVVDRPDGRDLGGRAAHE